ncbi:hypothetical protein FQA39_LY05822 [Lamprigera yunnana]|nr:hypothetical protein FQA39_LY05822 [Lamprigera yunnana]
MSSFNQNRGKIGTAGITNNRYEISMTLQRSVNNFKWREAPPPPPPPPTVTATTTTTATGNSGDLSLNLKPGSKTTSAPSSPAKSRESLLQRVQSLTGQARDQGASILGAAVSSASRVTSSVTSTRHLTLLVIDDQNTDWSKYFRGRRIGEYDIRVEQAEFKEITVTATAETANVSMAVFRGGTRVGRSFRPDFLLFEGYNVPLTSSQLTVHKYDTIILTLDLDRQREFTCQFIIADVSKVIMGSDCLSADSTDSLLMEKHVSVLSKTRITNGPFLGITATVKDKSTYTKLIFEYPDIHQMSKTKLETFITIIIGIDIPQAITYFCRNAISNDRK